MYRVSYAFDGPKVCPSCGFKEDMDVYKSEDAKRIVITMSG